MGGGGGFEAFGEAITVGEDRDRASVFWLGVVGPSYSVVRRDRGHRFELAVIASFHCPDGSLFIQEIEQRQMNDPNDGLTLTLLARDGNRYRFPPVVLPFPKPLFIPHVDVEAQYKVTVMFRTSDSLRWTWNKHKSSLLNAQAQQQRQQQQRARHQAAQNQFVAHHLVNPMQNMNLGM